MKFRGEHFLLNDAQIVIDKTNYVTDIKDRNIFLVITAIENRKHIQIKNQKSFAITCVCQSPLYAVLTVVKKNLQNRISEVIFLLKRSDNILLINNCGGK